MANSEILDAIEATINEALKKEIAPENRATLEVLRYFVAFFRQSYDDHKKVAVLWPAYLIGRWGVALLIAIGITDLATRFLHLIGK